MIESLQVECAALKSKEETYLQEKQGAEAVKEALSLQVKSLTEQHTALESKCAALETYRTKLEESVQNMKKFYEEERERIEAQCAEKYDLSLEKALFVAQKEAAKSYEDKMQTLQKNLDAYREKYYALLEKQAEAGTE